MLRQVSGTQVLETGPGYMDSAPPSQHLTHT